MRTVKQRFKLHTVDVFTDNHPDGLTPGEGDDGWSVWSGFDPNITYDVRGEPAAAGAEGGGL